MQVQPKPKPKPTPSVGPATIKLEDLPPHLRSSAAKALAGLSGGMTTEVKTEDAFDIEADFGAPKKQNKSEITKSQEDQNCK